MSYYLENKIKRRGVIAAPSPTRKSLPGYKKPLIVQESPRAIPQRKAAHIFDGSFKKELDRIPKHMHQKVARLVESNVELRVAEYMRELRIDVDQKMKQQQQEDQELIYHLYAQQKVTMESSQIYEEPDSSLTIKSRKIRTPRYGLATAKGPYAMSKVPQVIVALPTIDDSALTIGGIPYQAKRNSRERQMMMRNSLSPTQVKQDLNPTMSKQVMDWNQGLRTKTNGQSVKSIMKSKRGIDESSRLSKGGSNEIGSVHLPKSQQGKSRQGKQLDAQLSKLSGDAVVPHTQVFLDSAKKLSVKAMDEKRLRKQSPVTAINGYR